MAVFVNCIATVDVYDKNFIMIFCMKIKCCFVNSADTKSINCILQACTWPKPGVTACYQDVHVL